MMAMGSTAKHAWDNASVYRQLSHLTSMRRCFRFRRMMDRLRSPRRIAATLFAIVFFTIYLLNGIFIVSAREPADPMRLRLWLSGGMVLYAIYHCVRCAWSSNTVDLELSSSEKLWLGGAPLKRSTLAVYHVAGTIVSAMLKTLLLAVVLAIDVNYFGFLLLGVFTSLVLLETSRLIVARWSTALSKSGRTWFRIAATSVSAAVIIQVLARMTAMTPSGSDTWVYVLNGFNSLGDVAASTVVQWIAIPWIPGAYLAVTENWQWLTLMQLVATFATFPMMILLLVRVDAWSIKRTHQREQQRLQAGDFQSNTQPTSLSLNQANHAIFNQLARFVPAWASDTVAVMSRQWTTVVRYRGTLLFSFVIPTLLCLSPLATGEVSQQWVFVVGGIGLCTMLLAPPALRIDFRRDLRRMLMLRSMPVGPRSMVVGQLAMPILITWAFQAFTIAVATIVVRPDLLQVFLWFGLLTALAVFTFAIENALFLTYPHHERAEGVGMMVRAKLTFLGKATVIATSFGLLIAWSAICRDSFPSWIQMTVFVGGAVAAAWGIATAAMLVATRCWRRFDIGLDTPPE